MYVNVKHLFIFCNHTLCFAMGTLRTGGLAQWFTNPEDSHFQYLGHSPVTVAT